MQSGYGVPEIQQFVVDGCSSLFSMSNEMNNNGTSQQGKNHHHQQHHHQQQQQHRFHHHVHQIPITHQLLQHHQQFQAFQQHQHPQHQRRLHHQFVLDQESGPENSNSPSRAVGGPNFVAAAAAVNFKLAAANENSGSREALNEEDAMIRGDDGSDSRVHRWHREEDSTIKEPCWKPLDIDFISRNPKRCNEKLEISGNKYFKKSDEGNENEDGKDSGSNYSLLFGGELEAIYTCGSGVVVGNNQTGSGSALTGENPPATTTTPGPAGNNPPSSGIDHGSETSTGEEASLKKFQKSKRKRKRKQLSPIATFFENLVEQVMDHQENLHRKFLEVMEKRDQERTNREEAWRRQEMAKANREAMVRAQEQALSSSREAAIVSFLEKITGESINLPKKAQFQFQSQITEESNKEEKHIEEQPPINDFNINVDNNVNSNNARRWPKAEVQALIRVRSVLESRFQEQGLKGPLWEEISSSMAAMGYQRSAKRCKEKWENINKYFRKTKDSAKKRPQHSKTCPYFQQLDQLYSRPLKNASPNPSVASVATAAERRKENSELLDAIVVATDHAQNPSLETLEISRSFKFTETGSLRLNFGNNVNDNNNVGSSSKVGKELDNGEDDEDEEDDEEGDEGDADHEEHAIVQGPEREHVMKEQPQDTAFFRLES